MQRPHPPAAWLAALPLCLVLAGPVRAADAPPADATPAWLSQSAQAVGEAMRSAGSAAASAWSATTGLLTSPQPYDALPERIGDDDRQFFDALEAIGLRLSEVKVSGTLISHSSYRFVAAREPSNADIGLAQRKLEEYRAASGGLRARAKQRILGAVLELAGERDFVVTAVDVDLSPWPSAEYEMNARGRPPEAGERRVIGPLLGQ